MAPVPSPEAWPFSVSIESTSTKTQLGGLQTYTAYNVKVKDFGAERTIERRYAEFSSLHEQLAAVCRDIPPMPAKQWFASADTNIVAVRKPALEKILQAAIADADVVNEKNRLLWNFLEIPTPAVVAARFLCENGQIRFMKQLGKLTDEKYVKEHGHRLYEPRVLNTVVHTLEHSQRPAQKADEAHKDDNLPLLDDEELAAAMEVIRYVITTDQGRPLFLQLGGIGTLLNLFYRDAIGNASAPPNEGVKKALNTLIGAEKDNFPATLRAYLIDADGLQFIADYLVPFDGLHEILSKLFWIGFETEVQQAFVDHPRGLATLSQLFVSPSANCRVVGGLMLSCLLAFGYFDNDPGRKSKVSSGMVNLLSDLKVSTEAGDNAGEPGKSVVEEAFLKNLGFQKGLVRLASCLGVAGDPDKTISAEFALWVLVMMRPPIQQLKSTGIPKGLLSLMTNQDPKVRWTAAELLLHIRVTEASIESPEPDAHLHLAEEEQSLAQALQEQLVQSVQQIQTEVTAKKGSIGQQREVVDHRCGEKVDASADFAQFDQQLAKYFETRKELEGQMKKAERQMIEIDEGLNTITDEVGCAHDPKNINIMREMEQSAAQAAQLRTHLDTYNEQLAERQVEVDGFTKNLKDTEAEVLSSRTTIAECEHKMTAKQTEAMYFRDLANSDVEAKTAYMTQELNRLKGELLQMKEKISTTPPAEQQELLSLFKSTKEKAKTMQDELKGLQEQDPKAAAETAASREKEAEELRQKRDGLRAKQEQDEASANVLREHLATSTGILGQIRADRDGIATQISALATVQNGKWTTLREELSAKHKDWKVRIHGLKNAQNADARIADRQEEIWAKLEEEKDQRLKLVDVIANLKDTLHAVEGMLVNLG